jgi:restriction endonuclease S subunit
MKLKIKEITDIQMGYQFRGKVEPDPKGTHKVMQIRDFDEFQNLNVEGMYTVTPKSDAVRYMVSKGDVLFLSRGQRNFAIPIDYDLENTIAASYFFILRTKIRKVLPEYLAWYINQTPAQEYLHNIARRGTHMPLVPLSVFADLPIEVPDIKTQSTIVELSNLMEKERLLLNRLQDRRTYLVKAACLKAAKKEESIE